MPESLAPVGRPITLPRLYAIVDVEICAGAAWSPLEFARALIRGGARLLQLRAKAMESGRFLDLAAAMVQEAAAAGAQVIVNDRADIATLSGAAGVHVGQDDLSVVDVRRIVGDEAIVGLSTHSRQQLAEALTQAVSYVAIGPIYGTATKATGYDAVGIEMIAVAAEMASVRRVPVVAIGGITLARASEVWAAGAASAAVITDLVAADPAARAAEWVTASR